MRARYTDEKREFLLQYGAELPTEELTRRLNDRFHSNHSAASVRTTVKKMGVKKSKECIHNIRSRLGSPVGAAKIIGGYRYVKVGVSNGGFYADWRREIDVEYEKAYGAIPDGYMVVTLDGNKLNASHDNLCAISKSVAARMANGHGKKLWSEFPEVTRTAIEVCKLDEELKRVFSDRG